MSRPFSHFLDPSWGAGQTSPCHSLTSWAHLGRRSKQVQAILSLLGPILGAGQTSPGHALTSWAHLGERGKQVANKSRPFSHFLGPSWGAGKQVQAILSFLVPILGGGASKSRPFGPSWGAGQTSPGHSLTSWAHLGGAGQTSPGHSLTSWTHLGGRGKQVQAILSLLGPILKGGANKSRPFSHFLGPSRGAGQTSPGHSLTSWAHLGGRGKQVANKSRPFSYFLGPPRLGRGKQIQAILALLGPILGGGANKSRPFSHFLGPSCRAGQTSPGHSLTSWAHLGGRGKQVQAILSLLGPILGGGGKQVQAILSLLAPILEGGETSPGNSVTSWAHLAGRGKQVQAILSLLGPILGGGANKSRPFSHFLGPSWGAGQTSPGHSLTSWAHLVGRGKQIQAILSPIWEGQRGKQVQAILSLLGPILGGGANKSRPFSHFLGPSWGVGQTSGKQVQAILSLLGPILGGGGKQVQAILSLLGPILEGGETSPGNSVTSWAHLGGRGKQVQPILSLLGPILVGGAKPILGGGANKSRPFSHFLGPSWGAGQTSPGHSLTSWAHLGGGVANKSRPFSHFLGPSWGAGQTSPGHSLTSWAHLGGRGKQVQAILGSGANKSRPFSHFLGPSCGGRGKQVQPFSHFLGPCGNKSYFFPSVTIEHKLVATNRTSSLL